MAADRPARVACTTVADAATGAVIVRDGACAERFPPMSSFKLPLAVMGFDSGILTSPTEPVWTVRPELRPSKRELAFPTVDPLTWERESIVWFSQELTTRLGMTAFADYVTRFDYGNGDLSGDPGRDDGLTRAWLSSSLRISADEQVRFLLKLVRRELPVSERAVDLTKRTIPTFDATGGWVVHGKTGSGFPVGTSGAVDRSRPLGWFVGWAEKDGRTLVFATVEVGVADSVMTAGRAARDSLLGRWPALVAGR
ncbi:MAG TPA: class D beta-lactamase [Bauldia sp.]|nr:class D beta-lactamase [Bauldia sp.]